MLFVEKLSVRFFRCAVCLLVISVYPGAVFSAQNLSDYRYVINVEFSLKKARPGPDGYDKDFSLYQVKLNFKGETAYRTRLGFFKSRKEALGYLNKIKQTYQSAWLDTVKKYDEQYRSNWYNRKVLSKSKHTLRSSFMLDKADTARLMEKARKAIVDQDYQSAIKLYTKVISTGASEFRQDAQEYLGVAREKNGQYAHAKAEYQEYLHLYPEGEGTDRVRMRLNGILTALDEPRARLSKPKKIEKSVWNTYGYVAEFYRYDKFTQNDTTSKNASSTTSLGLFGRRSSEAGDIKVEMTGSYLYDMDEADDSRKRLTSLYIDYANRPKTGSIRFGRQRHVTSGVLGRMDGIWADYQFHPQWKFNAVAGYPVNLFETNRLQTDRKLYGFSLDIGPFDKYWDFNVFQIRQEIEGLTDREAVGGEIRYISPGSIFFTLVDYDTYFNELNKIYVVATRRFKDQTTLSVTYDKGKSPYMLTSNALQGQPFQSIEAMRGAYSDEEIRQIAIDRTADSTVSSVSATLPVSKKYSLNMDLMVSNLSGTPASANVPETASTGNEYFAGVQLIGNGVMLRNDTMIAGIGYADGSTYKRTSYSISERVTFLKKWRSNISLYYVLTDKTNGAETKGIKPALGIDYLYSRSLRLEADLAYDTGSTKGDTLSTDDEGFYVSLGLVYDF